MTYKIKPVDADYIAAQGMADRWILIAPNGRVWSENNPLVLAAICDREARGSTYQVARCDLKLDEIT
jgi:hypothetical protein